jgi:hypothetical protein
VFCTKTCWSSLYYLHVSDTVHLVGLINTLIIIVCSFRSMSAQNDQLHVVLLRSFTNTDSDTGWSVQPVTSGCRRLQIPWCFGVGGWILALKNATPTD